MLTPAGAPSVGLLKELRYCLPPLLVFNTAIAGLLTILGNGASFWDNLVFSQCMGGSIAFIHAPLLPRIPEGWRRGLTVVFTLPISILIGLTLGQTLVGIDSLPSGQYWQSWAVGLFFGAFGIVLFMLTQRILLLGEEVRQRRLAEETRARRETEARLRLLQAQIEPHFLFNTLANVVSLIDSDPGRARRLIERLNDWLRAALTQTRGERIDLGDELDWLTNWLEILRERFGERLKWVIEASPEARATPFPPMLLQPLVENAVKHGIEPKLGGGHLRIRAWVDGPRLHIEVEDDGQGLRQGSTGQGTGLDYIRARLDALFPGSGTVSLRPNAAGGVTAKLELDRLPA